MTKSKENQGFPKPTKPNQPDLCIDNDKNLYSSPLTKKYCVIRAAEANLIYMCFNLNLVKHTAAAAAAAAAITTAKTKKPIP